MSSSLFPVSARTGVAVLAFFLLGGLGRGAGAERPNFVVIVADDLRPSLGVYGDSSAVTPRLDAFVRKGGTLFQKAYANFPVCGPSRASFLSGRRPETSGVIRNGPETIRDLIPGVVTLPEIFKKNGYQTIGMGKIFHDDQDAASWTKYFFYPKTMSGYQGHKGAGKGAPMEFLDRPESLYPDGWQADTAVRWLENAPAQPFLLMVGLQKPHLPFVAPKKYWDMHGGKVLPEPVNRELPAGAPSFAGQDSYELRMTYEGVPKSGEAFSPELQADLRRGYYACVSFVDEQIGRILEALDRSGLAGNTVVVIFGDHGFHLRENGFWCKDDVFETGTRTAMVGRFPLFSAASSVNESVELVDLYPTLCSLAGIVPPYPLDGRDLVPFLKGEKPETDPVFSMVNRHDRVLGLSVRENNLRYTAWREKGTGTLKGEELYDYSLAVPEERNLVNDSSYADALPRLQALVKDHYASLFAVSPSDQ